MIASHYAEPLQKAVIQATVLRECPADDGAAVRELQPGEPFGLLDDSLGWAWGYAGGDRRVGYLKSSSLAQ